MNNTFLWDALRPGIRIWACGCQDNINEPHLSVTCPTHRELESCPCPNVVTSDEGTSYCALAEGRIRELETELAASRETNSRLNRRCQQYERGLAEKLAENKGPSLGRALANAAAEMCEQRAEVAEKRIRELEAELADTIALKEATEDAMSKMAQYGSETDAHRRAEAAEAALDKAQRALYALKVGEEPPEHDPITDSWWALIDKLKAAEAECSRLREALEWALDTLDINDKFISENLGAHCDARIDAIAKAKARTVLEKRP